MTLIDPAELSAFLDGELPPARAREIEALLAVDPALMAEYEALHAADASWREAGAAAIFVPEVALPAPARTPIWPFAVAAVLLLARVGGKFVENLTPSLLLNLAALALVVGGVLMASRAEQSAAR